MIELEHIGNKSQTKLNNGQEGKITKWVNWSAWEDSVLVVDGGLEDFRTTDCTLGCCRDTDWDKGVYTLGRAGWKG